MMRSLAALVALASPALADAPTTLHAEPAHVGHIGGKTIAFQTFEPGIRVDVVDLDQPQFDEHLLRLALTDGHTWWSAPDDLELDEADCGMGKCVKRTLDGVTIEQADGIVWIRLATSSQIRFNDPDARRLDRTTHETAVMGCTLPRDGQAPRCALYDAGVFSSSSVSIRGTTLTVHDDRGSEPAATVEFAF